MLQKTFEDFPLPDKEAEDFLENSERGGGRGGEAFVCRRTIEIKDYSRGN